MTDPEIEIFDIARYAGMEHYAAHSERLAPFYRQWAAAAENAQERESCLARAALHEELARKYRLAECLLAEINQALREEEEGMCPFS